MYVRIRSPDSTGNSIPITVQFFKDVTTRKLVIENSHFIPGDVYPFLSERA